MNVQWFALYQKDTGQLYAQASIDLDDEDTAIDKATGQPYSLSGMKGIAHPDAMAEKGLQAVALAFNPQEAPQGDPEGVHEWDAAKRGFAVRSGKEMRRRRLADLEGQVSSLRADMAKRGER